MYLVTGDKHGHISSIKQLARNLHTTLDDVLIILGDAGFNYHVYKDSRTGMYNLSNDNRIHKELAQIPLTILVVQGNHEAPAWECSYMKTRDGYGGTVYYNPEAPNVLYLKNGEIYTINNRKYLVLGGASSIDKPVRAIPGSNRHPYAPAMEGMGRKQRQDYAMYCLMGKYWFPEEQMTEKEYTSAIKNMEREGNKVHGILAHTCPKTKAPTELFLELPEGWEVDNTMENRFEQMIQNWEFDKWYFGHYHGDFEIDDTYEILFVEYKELE